MDGHPIADRIHVAEEEDPAERLAALFDTHHDRLYRLARRLVPTGDDALDLVQETFLRAARSLPKSPAGRAREEEAWLVRILVNLRRDQWRKSEVRNRHRTTAGQGVYPGQDRRNPETTLIAKTTVWQALDLLPPRRRAIIVMHELDAMEIPAIASQLGISAITVRWHLSAGRRDLARTLKPYMGGSK